MLRDQALKMLHKTFKYSVNEKDGDLRLDFPSCKAPPQTLSPPIPIGHSPKPVAEPPCRHGQQLFQ